MCLEIVTWHWIILDCTVQTFVTLLLRTFQYLDVCLGVPKVRIHTTLWPARSSHWKQYPSWPLTEKGATKSCCRRQKGGRKRRESSIGGKRKWNAVKTGFAMQRSNQFKWPREGTYFRDFKWADWNVNVHCYVWWISDIARLILKQIMYR